MKITILKGDRVNDNEPTLFLEPENAGDQLTLHRLWNEFRPSVIGMGKLVEIDGFTHLEIGLKDTEKQDGC